MVLDKSQNMKNTIGFEASGNLKFSYWYSYKENIFYVLIKVCLTLIYMH